VGWFGRVSEKRRQSALQLERGESHSGEADNQNLKRKGNKDVPCDKTQLCWPVLLPIQPFLSRKKIGVGQQKAWPAQDEVNTNRERVHNTMTSNSNITR